MRKIAISLLACILSGCIVQKVNIYRPTNEGGRYEQRYRGLLNISYGKTLKGKTSINLSGATKDKSDFGLFLQISVEKGSRVELDSWAVRLSSPDFEKDLTVPIGRLSVSIYGRGGKAGHYGYIEPGQVLVGEALNEEVDKTVADAFITSIQVKENAPEQLSVTLPDFIIDGSRITVPAIKFDLIEDYNYVYSIQ